MNKLSSFKMNNGINLVKDEKFTNVLFSLRINFELSRKDVTIANLMSIIFTDRLENYPSKGKIMYVTDSLYGVRINSSYYTAGQQSVIDISLRGINDSFVNEGLHQKYYDLLEEILYRPLIDEFTLNEAKKNLAQSIIRLKEKPNAYAIFTAFEKASKDGLFGISPNGYIEDLDAITLEDVKVFHQRCVNEFDKELYIVGNVDPSEIKINDIYADSKSDFIHKTAIKNETEIEEYKGNQSELLLIYEMDINPLHKLYYAFVVFIAVLGQSSNSLLFRNVREKNSLAYSVYASQLMFDGLFYIGTSVDPKNENKVIDLIDEQFELIKNGEFELETSKKYLTNNILGTSESTRSLLEFISRNNRLKVNDTKEEVITNINEVSKEEVIEVLEYVKDRFIFIYRGVEDETNS